MKTNSWGWKRTTLHKPYWFWSSVKLAGTVSSMHDQVSRDTKFENGLFFCCSRLKCLFLFRKISHNSLSDRRIAIRLWFLVVIEEWLSNDPDTADHLLFFFQNIIHLRNGLSIKTRLWLLLLEAEKRPDNLMVRCC